MPRSFCSVGLGRLDHNRFLPAIDPFRAVPGSPLGSPSCTRHLSHPTYSCRVQLGDPGKIRAILWSSYMGTSGNPGYGRERPNPGYGREHPPWRSEKVMPFPAAWRMIYRIVSKTRNGRMAGKTEIAVFVARIFIIDPLEFGNLVIMDTKDGQ
uniref:Uncharacterized protein n=1 Tax=Candidatus Kentrum sp. FW TaxID=2126338 RepID=A0A450SFG0_9GAMM|nr:MAG: hypothetical protein BECKFW1821A_GA0114235_101239 [Candidatus Kentron sp. FW]VFJ51590.1 MAG: hypothetical protein BECKFW1821B_GA0114236_100947 [Candidatus Kentron sp. FW]